MVAMVTKRNVYLLVRDSKKDLFFQEVLRITINFRSLCDDGFNILIHRVWL